MRTSRSPHAGRQHVGLPAVVSELMDLFGRYGLTYEQTAEAIKQARRRLGLLRPVRARKLPEVISAQEAERLIAAAYRGGPAQGLIVKTLWITMVRVSELAALEAADVHLDEGYAKVRGGKGAKDRLVVLTEALTQEMVSYLVGRSRGPLFVSRHRGAFTVRRIEQIVSGAARAARIGRPVRPHTLRRSMATHLLNRGAREEVVSTLLGHTSTETTRAAYARLSIASLKDEVERALAPAQK